MRLKKSDYRDIMTTSLEDWKHLAASNTKELMNNLCAEYKLYGLKNILYRGTTFYKKEIKSKNKLAEIEIATEKGKSGSLVYIKTYKMFI